MHYIPPVPETLARIRLSDHQPTDRDLLLRLVAAGTPPLRLDQNVETSNDGRFNNVESESTDADSPIVRKRRGQASRAQKNTWTQPRTTPTIGEDVRGNDPDGQKDDNSSEDEFHTPPSSPLQAPQPEPESEQFVISQTSRLRASRNNSSRRPHRASSRKFEKSRIITKENSMGRSFASTAGSSSASSSFTEAYYPPLDGSFQSPQSSQSTAPTSVNSSFSGHVSGSSSKNAIDFHRSGDRAGDLSTVQEASNSGSGNNTTSDPFFDIYDGFESTDEDEPHFVPEPIPSIVPQQLPESENGKTNGYEADASGYFDSSELELETVATSFELALAGIVPPSSSQPESHPFKKLPYQIQYEATRVALSLGVSVSTCNKVISGIIRTFCDDLCKSEYHYRDIWKILKNFAQALAGHARLSAEHTEMPPPTNETVWRTFANSRGWLDSAHLSGTACYVDGSSKVDFTIRLNPLSCSQGNRLFHRFGSDRFLVLRLPSPWDKEQRSKGLRHLTPEKVLEGTVNWLVGSELHLMNRTWRCFYIKETKGRKKSKDPDDRSLRNEYYQQAYFFAERGVGLGSASKSEQDELGFRSVEKKLRQEFSREQLIGWHLPLDEESTRNQSLPKVWSRISLALSTSVSTMVFEPHQIFEVPDKVSSINKDKVMDDGCSICSPAVLRKVGEILGLDETPTAVQGRLGGAKGIWMADPKANWMSEEIYIYVNQSQLKFVRHKSDFDPATLDPARLTLDVLFYSKEPSPAAINLQFLPILEKGGVPFEVFREVLEEYFEDALNDALRGLDDPILLRRWVCERGSLLKDRLTTGEIPEYAGMPTSQKESVIMLLDAGFMPRTCGFLIDRVWQMLVQYCDDLLASLHITLKRSTHLFCVADPTDTLKEGEVSLYFSKGPLNPDTKRHIDCLEQDILVARNPAHLPSDVQKVRAVSTNNAQLRNLKDVIVFSTKGQESLASLLSGGDYDGDKPWVCWDNRLVQPFQNSKSKFTTWDPHKHFTIAQTKLRDLNMQHPAFFDRFFQKGFTASMEESHLGRVTVLFERYCYSKRLISDRTAVLLAKLCSALVDAQKQGMRPRQKTLDFISDVYSHKYGRIDTPAYKGTVAPNSKDPTSWHLLDRLKFEVARGRIENLKTGLHKDVVDRAAKTDKDLTELWRAERNKAENDRTSPLARVLLKHLLPQLYAVGDAWGREFPPSRRSTPFGLEPASTIAFGTKILRVYALYDQIKPPEYGLSHPVIQRWSESADDPFSAWRLIKASALFYRYGSQRLSFPWWMAARELCYLKATAVARRSGQTPRILTQNMYISLKEHKSFLKQNVEIDDEED